MLLAVALQLELIRHSLTGTHYRYVRDGVEVSVTVRPDGTCEGPDESCDDAGRRSRVAGASLCEPTCFAAPATGDPRPHAVRPARVFAVNPVEKLNDPGLQDQNNSANAVPDAAYTVVELDNVNASGPLGGPWVQIMDLQLPAVTPAGSSGSLLFDRSQPGFEDVNAYYHVDRSQKYLQSIGYRGDRGIAPYPVEVDTHAANGADASSFIPLPELGHGALIFGDGGTDDAEDPDLVVHEYAHAIHEWISPGTFLGPFNSQGRAMSEGFADYWGFSASYAGTLQSGRDPFCFADWDARCWQDSSSENCAYAPGSNCLRRLDSTKTVADFETTNENGTQYRNGEIWSSALREIVVALTQRYGIDAGKRTADTLVLESLFGAPPNPGFAGIARKMIAADRYLNASANSDLICAAMVHRGILTDCVAVPRGELTIFQSRERGVVVPDNLPAGVTFSTVVADSRAIDKLAVRVDIEHPLRGDLQIVLVAPDGTEVILQNPSTDRSRDIHATFGRDAVPVESLDIFRGRSAAGEWKVRVSDLRGLDSGTFVSFSLVIQFAGDVPSETRPQGVLRQIIPVVGRVRDFRSDIRLLNRGTGDVTATLVFTPSGADGRNDFAAVKVNVAAGTVVALTDIVGATFGAEGIGQLEIDGAVLAASRTYATTGGGTAGEAIPPSMDDLVTTRFTPPLFVTRLVDTPSFRSNLGIAETSGNSGLAEVVLYDASSGVEVSRQTYPILSFSHMQIPVNAATSMTAQISAVGSAQLVAYGSIVNNATEDATYVAGQPPSTARTVMAPAINAGGAFGTQWTTDLWLSRIDPVNAEHPLVVTYTDRSTLATRDLSSTVPTFASRRFPDVVRLSFFAQGTAGLMTTFLDRGMVASAVIANDGYAQSAPFQEPMAQTALDIPFVESSQGFRTNVGLMSLQGAVVVVTVLDAAGDMVDTSTHVVEATRLDQFGVSRPVVNGRVHLDVLSGRIAAYVSVVDNVTGDASFVPAR